MADRDISELVARYLDDAEIALNKVEGKPDTARHMQKEVRALREYLEGQDAATRTAMEILIAQTIVLENLTYKAPTNRIVDAYNERIDRIRKKSEWTAEQLREAEKKFKTRKAQADYLGISTGYLRRLRRKLL